MSTYTPLMSMMLLINEITEVKSRMDHLGAYINKVTFMSPEEASLIQAQLAAMVVYAETLGGRLKLIKATL